ncbi:MAG TPA: hypothetical protein VIK95_13320 [Egibacteraceae bacterium]
MTDLLTRTTTVAPDATAVAVEEGAFRGSVAEALAIAVAPSTGRFRPSADAGGRVRAGQVLGHVTGGRGRADAVRSPVDATVRALLARPGQQVRRGQALAWLELGDCTTAAAGTTTA